MQKSILIQNVDVDAKPAQFKHLLNNELLVYSTFYTIQGEGPYAGHVAFFIRLAGCNFGSKSKMCGGCDTRFTLSEGVVTPMDELIVKATDAVGKGGLIVVTGGEPCLQKNLSTFVSVAIAEGLVVQIETNGSQSRVMDECAMAGANIVCSPKAGPKGYGRTLPISLPDTIGSLKFVVTSVETDFHHAVPVWAFDWVNANPKARKLYVSPLTVYLRNVAKGEIVSAWNTTLVDHEATSKNYAYAADIALENRNVIVSTQQHTFLALE